MRVAHLADVHLGLRRYARTNPAGSNQREQDVMVAFATAVDQVIAARVDAVLLAGDLFDAVRPGNTCILEAYRLFRRLTEGLPGIPIVVVGGNHDTPRSLDTGVILGLFAEFSAIRVVTRQPASVRMGELSVACFPAGAEQSSRPALEPDPTARWNVYLAHIAADMDCPPWEGSSWDYVALGDWHVAREITAGVWYAGSLEYVSTNPWGELQEERARGVPGKGWILAELRPDAFPLVEFQPVPTRPHVDLPVIDTGELIPADVDALLAERMTIPEVTGAVVRQVLVNARRGFARELDYQRIRRYRATALHFHLDVRRATERRPLMAVSAAVRESRSLVDVVAEALANRPLAPDVDRDTLTELARIYMGDSDSAVSAVGSVS